MVREPLSGQQAQTMEIDAEILTRRLTAKYTTRKGKAGPGHRTIDGSFASYRKGTRMSGFRGCGARSRRPRGFSMRPAQSLERLALKRLVLTVERLETRCVLSAMGPDLPLQVVPAPIETSVAPPVSVAAPPVEQGTQPMRHQDFGASHTPEILMPDIHPTEIGRASCRERV